MREALAAGVLAPVNPCGFLLLPAYVCLLVLYSEQGRLRRALGHALATTLGFCTVMAVFGLLAQRPGRGLPTLTVAIGLMVLVAGIRMAAGRPPPRPPARHPRAPELVNRFPTMFLFGIVFALVSLGSIAGPFLDLAGRRLPFLAYAAGFGLVTFTLSVATALAQQPFLRQLRRRARVTRRVGGVWLAVGGAYAAWCGLAARSAGETRDPVSATARAAHEWLAAVVAGLGVVMLALLLAALVVALVVTRMFRASAARPTDS
jgi:cytochrome c biogenesis protein CcdA